MTIVTKNSLTLSNVNDGTITHYAYANSADGTDRFTTVYPNLNLLTGTRDFSGAWIYGDVWATDGTYNGLTVKKRTGQWVGIHKVFIAPKDGTYTFSAYIKSSGDNANIYRFGGINTAYPQDAIQKFIGNNFDWTKDTVTLNLKANDTAFIRYEISGESSDLILWTAGHKWEPGSIATPHMPSASEVTTADWPSYIGQYTDFMQADSTNPSDYTWSRIRGNDGATGPQGERGKQIFKSSYESVPNNSGHYWSDLSPAPSIDNPPKIGDTVITPSGNILQIDTVNVGGGGGGGTFGVGDVLGNIKGPTGNDGVAGKDGVGIKTTTVTYAISTSGTTAPTTGWSSQVPALLQTQYLWTKTVWTYTDNSSETGYSVTYISKDGNNGNDGIAGKDGVGILTTTITYTGSTNGTTAPTSGWTSTVPTVEAGSYLWTKTIWTYTDNTSETGYSVAKMGNDGATGPQGERGKQIFKSSYESVPHNSGHYWSDLSPAPSIDNPPKIGDTVITPSGNILQIDTVNVGGGGGGGTFGVGDVLGNIKGPTGSNGDPGKIVSDTEPTTRFKGLTWKYLGTSDLTASDGTVILSGTEYYWSGTNWILSEINAHNINGDNLNVKNGKFTDGVIETSWQNGTVAGSTNIENDHLIITRTDSSVNTTNSIGLDSTQGLIMTYTENSTGRTISVGTNFQGMSLTDSTGTSASISPAGVKLSSDVNWTKIGNIGGRRAEWKRENNRVTMNIHGGNGDGFPVITSGGTLLGILPTNARPPSDISMPATAQAANATAQISINSSGEVRCYRWGGDSIYFGAYISYYVE